MGRMRNEITGRPPHSGFLSICFRVSLNKGFVFLKQDKKVPLTLFFSCQDFPAALHAQGMQSSDGTGWGAHCHSARLQVPSWSETGLSPQQVVEKHPERDGEPTKTWVKPQMYQEQSQSWPGGEQGPSVSLRVIDLCNPWSPEPLEAIPWPFLYSQQLIQCPVLIDLIGAVADVGVEVVQGVFLHDVTDVRDQEMFLVSLLQVFKEAEERI